MSINFEGRRRKAIPSTQVVKENAEDFSESPDDEDECDIVETLEVEDDEHTDLQKNKRQTSVTDQPSGSKRFKLSKDNLYKPPTSEELNTLKETENLFHSNLFRLQIDELLAEVKVKKKVKVDDWILNVQSLLLGLPDGELYDINDQKWIKATGIAFPICQIPFENKGVFRFLKPAEIHLIGGYPLQLSCQSSLKIDFAVKMPKACFHHSDYLNHRYHRKRAMYLLCLAHHLQKNYLIGELKFTYFHGDHLKPVLLVKPNGKLAKKCTLSIFPYLPHDFFKVNRFLPCRNNVRPTWFFKENEVTENVATPRYNSSILFDMIIEQSSQYIKTVIGDSSGIRDGIILLKVWARQRYLDQGFGGFSSYIQTMFILYLLQNKKLNPLMSSYQVVRNTWLQLTQSDWTQKGISLVEISTDNQPTLEEFHEAFEVVFIDPLGLLNICANMSAVTFYRVRHEAEMALKFIDDNSSNSFDALFMLPVPFVQRFDHLLHINSAIQLKLACEKLGLHSSLLDNGGNVAVTVLPKLVSFLRSGLGNRIQLLDICLQKPPVWTINDNPPTVDTLSSLLLGFLLDPNFSATLLEKGPSADSSEAVQFREFWGDISEMRRFPDGSICEAVVWPGSTIAHKRMTCKHIVTQILSRHAFIPESDISDNYFGGELDCLLNRDVFEQLSTEATYGTGEEQIVDVLQAFDCLSKQLRKLDGLVLNINSVQGISAVFRYTEVFPPLPIVSLNKITDAISQKKCILKDCLSFCPQWNPPQRVVLQLDSSSKWPEDQEAFRRLKAAFHIKLGELLENQSSMICNPYAEYVDVFHSGYIFRLMVANRREITALKTVAINGIVKMQNTEAALSLEATTELLPKITSVLHGLQMQYSTYCSTCRLVKRWISSQLLTDHISDILIDLIIAYLFVSPLPFTPPSCPQVGFLRFLTLVSTFDWKNLPLIINFNGELTKEDITEVQTKFISVRATLPAMFVATPYDKFKSFWSKSNPTKQILHRLIVLARQALTVFENQLMLPRNDFDYKSIFRPPLDPYDVIIHLNPNQVPTVQLSVDKMLGKRLVSRLSRKTSGELKVMPIVDYNPALIYLKELRETFDEFALFFYDHFGGIYITVLWKPSAFEPQSFKVTNIAGRMATSNITSANDTTMVTPNVLAIIEEFGNLGQGLVTVIETKTEKWIKVQ